ncbi:acyl carrier protein [Streptomyces sp. A7024]|uniref:Acyl carrier protein n=1 Tax=Streptomyces coryli TaxID=1128680 RepID=A0A6G4U2U2_9ACTN|nr:acyl carrier protein [Streptomyces coryli]NGN65551.1 acyl carrier protein [Streptomyces coryli]
MIEDIVSAVVGRPVAAEDNFYDLGGTSLQAIRICTRIRKEAGVRISPEALFNSENIGEFAAAVAELRHAS